MPDQLAASRRIDLVDALLGADRCRFALKLPLHSGFLHHIFNDKLGHRTSANIPLAEEEKPDHTSCDLSTIFDFSIACKRQFVEKEFQAGDAVNLQLMRCF